MLTSNFKLLVTNLGQTERAVFRANMCGVCAVLGDSYGLPHRLLMRSETVLASVLIGAQEGSIPSDSLRRCPLNPLRKVAANLGHGACYGAAISVVLGRLSFEDRVRDRDRGSTVAQWYISGFGGAARNAKSVLRASGFDVGFLDQVTRRQAEAEKSPISDPEATSAALGSEMFRTTGSLAKAPQNFSALKELGAAFGRCIYLRDAFHDLPDDMHYGAFNPLRRFATDRGDRIIFGYEGLRWLHTRLIGLTSQVRSAWARLVTVRNRNLVLQLTEAPLEQLLRAVERIGAGEHDVCLARFRLPEVLAAGLFLRSPDVMFWNDESNGSSIYVGPCSTKQVEDDTCGSAPCQRRVVVKDTCSPCDQGVVAEPKNPCNPCETEYEVKRKATPCE